VLKFGFKKSGADIRISNLKDYLFLNKLENKWDYRIRDGCIIWAYIDGKEKGGLY
jgi:hypothetical protein